MATKKKKNSKKKNRIDDKSENKLKKEVKGETLKGVLSIVLTAFGIIFFLAAFNLAGKVGTLVYSGLDTALGLGYYLLPLSSFIFAFALYKSTDNKIGPLKSFAMLFFFISSLALVEMLFNGYGGFLGGAIAKPVTLAFDKIAGSILLLALATASLFVIFDSHPGEIAGKIKKKSQKDEDEITQKEIDQKITNNQQMQDDIKEDANTAQNPDTKENHQNTANIIQGIKTVADKVKDGIDIDIKDNSDMSNYRLPSLKILSGDKGKPGVGDVKANAIAIKRTLANFGIQVEMDEITIGPSVTRYAMKPAEGVRLNKILSLQSNLELALAASPIRIEAPIPGKSLVGIEVPNTDKTLLGLGTILRSRAFKSSPMVLPMALGRDITGEAHFADLARAPHMLIAGATNMGKSVTIHDLLISLLYKYGPDRLKFIMVDPKRVELTLYNGIPHLLTPVITDAKKTILTLKWLIGEMERRYDILENYQIQNLKDYHKNVVENYKGDPDEAPENLPYIVTVIDELADIMQSYPKELESAIVRIAQKARAVGIHLMLATQRPDVKTITGLIKANIPTRIALKVPSQIDSRTILDEGGAEKLLGAGDLLYVSGGMSKPIRLQAPFVSNEEIRSVVTDIKKNFAGELKDEINLEEVGHDNVAFTSGQLFDEEDERNSEEYKMAKQIVIDSGKASVSFIQRKMRIGYNKASRFMDLLEEEGVVGPQNGSKPREVYSRPETTPTEEQGTQTIKESDLDPDFQQESGHSTDEPEALNDDNIK